MRLIDRVFRMEELNGGKRCPTYMYRWTILKFFGLFSVYLHHFVADDWSKDMHDHPKRFVSIGLHGRYVEETPSGERRYHAPWIRTFAARHIHRIRLDGGDCWTLVIVFRAVREWGFWHDGRWFFWKAYVGSEQATKSRNC